MADGIVSTVKNTQDYTYTYAIKGINQSLGIYSAGVYGESPKGIGVFGKCSGNGWAVFGSSNSGYGIIGTSESSAGGVFQSSYGPALLTNGGPIGINTVSPKYLMTFQSVVGDKISFWGGETNNTTPHYGIGVQGGTLQFFVPTTGDNLVFGVGRSGDFSEKFRITGNGNLQNSGVDAGYRFYDRNTTAKSFQWYAFNGNAYLFRHHNGSGNVLSVLENGNLEVGAYTRLGNTVPAGAEAGATNPAVKTLKLVGTTANSQGVGVTIHTGLDAAKILGVQVIVDNHWLPGTRTVSNVNYEVALYDGSVFITNKAGESSDVLAKPIRVLITYEE